MMGLVPFGKPNVIGFRDRRIVATAALAEAFQSMARPCGAITADGGGTSVGSTTGATGAHASPRGGRAMGLRECSARLRMKAVIEGLVEEDRRTNREPLKSAATIPT
jgi:hypothetical protein